MDWKAPFIDGITHESGTYDHQGSTMDMSTSTMDNVGKPIK